MSVTSQTALRASAQAAFISATASSISALLRATRVSFTPARAKTRAIPRPMPLEPPVTMTLRPFSELSILFLPFSFLCPTAKPPHDGQPEQHEHRRACHRQHADCRDLRREARNHPCVEPLRQRGIDA